MDKKRIGVAFLIVLTNTIGATAILPMLPIYVEKQFQATPVQATVAIAAYYAAQIFAAPWLGKLSDRIGRRPVLIISQIGTIISYFLFVFAAQLGSGLDQLSINAGVSGGLLMIYVARVVDGLTGGNVSVAEAYASDISDDKSRTQALGMIGGAVGLGHILGPVLAAVLSGFSLTAPIIGATVISGITLLLTALLLTEVARSAQKSVHHSTTPSLRVSQLLSERAVLLVLSAALPMALYIAAAVSSLSLYTERVLFAGSSANVVIQNTGMMIVVMGLVAAVAQTMLTGKLANWLGEQTVVVLGSALLLASAIGIGAAQSVLPVVISIVAYGLGYALAWPSLQAIVTRFGSKESAGRLLGLFQSVFSLALIVSPLGAGLLLETGGPRVIFYVGAGLMGLAFVLSVVLMHLPLPASSDRQESDRATQEPRGFFARLHH